MTHESSSSEGGRPPDKRRKGRSRVWRVAAVVVVILVTLALAHYLRCPSGVWDGDEGGGDLTVGQWPPEVEPSGRTARPGDPPKPDARPTTNEEATDDLRQVMAGLVMAAIGDGADTDDPRNQDAESKRRFIADAFGLPYDYPRNKAPADLMPQEAQVLMVFENPERAGCRMVLVRMRKDVGAALEAFCKLYDRKGWRWDELANPRKDRDSQPDRGWLVRFRKGKRERIVYARARAGGEETLVAIYDPRY